MVKKTTLLQCNICGKTFTSEYYTEGSIHHNNYTNSHNMQVWVNRINSEGEGTLRNFFLDSINLYGATVTTGNDIDRKVAMDIYNCRTMWLIHNNHKEIAQYLTDNRVNIDAAFRDFAQILIDRKLEEIEQIKLRFGITKNT